MTPTPREINLYSLLLCCQARLNTVPVETWTASEKRKFAAVRITCLKKVKKKNTSL